MKTQIKTIVRTIATTTLLIAAQAASGLDATPLFSVKAGAAAWNSDVTGDLGDGNTDIEELGFGSETNGVFYVAFEHVIPVLPQIRIEQTNISTQGETSDLNNAFDIDDVLFDSDATLNTDIDLEFFDATLYYEIFWLDLGINIRSFDAEITAIGQSQGQTETVEVDESGVLPLLYAAARFDLPLSGLYISGSASYLGIDDQEISDFRAALGYSFKIPVIAEIGFEGGYRRFEVDLGDDDDNDFAGEIELAGPYLGVNINF